MTRPIMNNMIFDSGFLLSVLNFSIIRRKLQWRTKSIFDVCYAFDIPSFKNCSSTYRTTFQAWIFYHEFKCYL